MIQNKAGMLMALMMLSGHGTSYASMDVKTRLNGLYLQPGVSYQLQSHKVALDGVECAIAGGRSVSLINAFWPQAISDITAGWVVPAGIPLPAVNLADHAYGLQYSLFVPDELWQPEFGDRSTAAQKRDTERGVMADIAGNFQRIDILQYAQVWTTEVIPDIEIPAYTHTAAYTMEARHRRFMLLGLSAQVHEYRWLGPADKSLPASEPRRLTLCFESSKRLVAKAIAEFRAMHQKVG